MTRIVAGTFDTASKAEAALRALLAAGVPRDCVTSFHNNPPGQHGTFPIGGDEHADPETRGVEKRAAGAAAIGAGIGAGVGAVVGGPLGAAAGAGAGAFAGAMAGAFTGLAHKSEEADPPARRPAGTVVAVASPPGFNDDTVLRVLQANNPVAIEEAEGEWRDGEWKDFDPLARPGVVGGPRN